MLFHLSGMNLSAFFDWFIDWFAGYKSSVMRVTIAVAMMRPETAGDFTEFGRAHPTGIQYIM